MTVGAMPLRALDAAQKAAFDRDGSPLVRGLYAPAEIDELRERFHQLLRAPEGAHPGLRYSYEQPEVLATRPVDPNNPHGVWLIMDTPLAGDVAFIHVLVVHRAGDNYSGGNRSALINEYKTKAARPLKYQPLAYNELPLLRGGHRVV